MAPARNARRKQKRRAIGKPTERPKPLADPDAPGPRLRRFVEQTLRADPGLTLPGLLDAANAWAKQGHTHMGYRLWSGERPFGPHYMGLLLREGWAAKLGSEELRRQARFFRENPDKDLDDLARETRARLEALRARDAEKRERQARKAAERAERRRKAEADRKEKERIEQERRERERNEREERAAEQARRRRAAVLQRIVDFFQSAGIDATSDGRSARVAGVLVTPSKGHVASRAKLDELLDSLVWTHHRDALLQSIGRHLRGARELRAVAGTNGWILSTDGSALGVVRATSGKVRSQPPHSGNYLTSDADWRVLADEIEALRARFGRPQPRVRQRILTELPDSLPTALHELALDASHQLRTERNLVFGHAVELRYGDGSVRFEPLRQAALHVELPLQWSSWSDDASAEIRIDGKRDPLHLVFRGHDDDSVVVHGWVLALVAYAQLVCREDLDDLLRSRPRRASPRRPPASGNSTPRPASGPVGDGSIPGLKPIGRTRWWITSYVAGHRRRLRPGHRASSEARARAARVGITLREGETWVSPHVRGVPPDAVLQFHWSAPAELRLDPA